MGYSVSCFIRILLQTCSAPSFCLTGLSACLHLQDQCVLLTYFNYSNKNIPLPLSTVSPACCHSVLRPLGSAASSVVVYTSLPWHSVTFQSVCPGFSFLRSAFGKRPYDQLNRFYIDMIHLIHLCRCRVSVWHTQDVCVTMTTTVV